MTPVVLNLSELMAVIQAKAPGVIRSIDTLRRRIDALDIAGVITVQRVGTVRTVKHDDVPEIISRLQSRIEVVKCC